MARTTTLYTLLALLMLDALVEVGLLGSMVGYLHREFIINIVDRDHGRIQLFSKPLHLSKNQGHTSNGAAGTAFFLVGLLGFIVLSQRPKIERRFHQHLRPIFGFWTILSILALLLTVSATIYTFVIEHLTSGQSISFADPSLNLRAPVRYPFNNWTPQTWYRAVLQLKFADAGQESNVRSHLRMMDGWKWNLLPLLVLQATIAVFTVLEWFAVRKGYTRPNSSEVEPGDVKGDGW